MPLYLALDLAAVAIPLAFSFEKRLQFYKLWKPLFSAIAVVGIVFVAWDSWFTSMGIWGFDSRYLSGIFIFNLPLEEILFFICVPYASVFTFHVFRTLLPRFTLPSKVSAVLVLVPAAALGICAILFRHLWYTGVTAACSGIALILSHLFFKKYMPHFMLSFAAILIPFFFMNGILTGTWIDGEVVWYDNSENLGIRILTIPVEDIFYGLTLILGNIMLTISFAGYFSKSKV